MMINIVHNDYTIVIMVINNSDATTFDYWDNGD